MPASALRTLPKRDAFLAEAVGGFSINPTRQRNTASSDSPSPELIRRMQCALFECPDCGENLDGFNVAMNYTMSVSDDYNPMTGDSDRQDESDCDDYAFECRNCGHSLDDDFFIFKIHDHFHDEMRGMNISRPQELAAYIQEHYLHESSDTSHEDNCDCGDCMPPEEEHDDNCNCDGCTE